MACSSALMTISHPNMRSIVFNVCAPQNFGQSVQRLFHAKQFAQKQRTFISVQIVPRETIAAFCSIISKVLPATFAA
jgi:hypothetical protein